MYLYEQQNLRSYPFEQLPFHGKVRKDFITFLKPYSRILPDNLDLRIPSNVEEGVGYGRLICVFKCRTQVNVGEEVTEHHLAFMEELWPFTPRIPDVLMDVYGHKILYSLKPRKVFYVLEMSRILGPASIFRNPGMTSIPKGGLTKTKKMTGLFIQNYLAKEGCELFRLNMWNMKWGCKRSLDTR